MVNKPLPQSDLDGIVELLNISRVWDELRGARIFVTGGTGFFGHWLLETLLLANRQLSLGAQVTVLTRDAQRFESLSPWIANDAAVTLLQGDVANFKFPAELFSHIVHAATDSGGRQSAATPDVLAGSIVGGTDRVLSLARASGARLLYVSTGAVYGRSTTVLNTAEDYPIRELPTGSYEAAKLAAERACLASGVDAVIARCFAFVGPRLPLDQHFAIGNFIGAALEGRTLEVKGDGTPRRSWMYTGDLAAWLWTLLVRGHAGRAYNVGSDAGMTVADAARLVADTLAHELAVTVAASQVSGAPLNSYVPLIKRAQAELGLKVSVSLPDALRRTAAWYR
jgi:dTDP-glucose 4,6-dehydratase